MFSKRKKEHPQDTVQGTAEGKPEENPLFSPASKKPDVSERFDPESPEDSVYSGSADVFKDPKVRSKFVRRVYIILTIQLAFTAAFNIPFVWLDEAKEFLCFHKQIVYIGMVTFIIPFALLLCSDGCRRKFPRNAILLSIMTLGMSIVTAYVTARVDAEVMLYAVSLTVIITVVITITAIICPIDFTNWKLLTFIVSIGLIVFATSAAIVYYLFGTYISHVLLSGGLAAVFCWYLLHDTQAIIRGKRTHIEPNEYILGAIQVYVDVIEIMLNLIDLVAVALTQD